MIARVDKIATLWYIVVRRILSRRKLCHLWIRKKGLRVKVNNDTISLFLKLPSESHSIALNEIILSTLKALNSLPPLPWYMARARNLGSSKTLPRGPFGRGRKFCLFRYIHRRRRVYPRRPDRFLLRHPRSGPSPSGRPPPTPSLTWSGPEPGKRKKRRADCPSSL